MSVDDIAARLRKTEKGSLPYRTTGLQWPSINKLDISPKQLPKQVFNILDSRAVLETCEELSFATENLHFEQEQAKIFKTQLLKTQDVKHNRDEAIEVLDVERAAATIAEDFSQDLKKAKEVAIGCKTKLYEDASTVLSNDARERLIRRQEKNLQKDMKIQDQLNKYFHESEDDAKRILQQNKEQHKSRHRILKTRIEEAENRRLQKLQQGKERMQKAEPMVLKCSEIYKNLLRQIQETSNGKMTSDESVRSIVQQMQGRYITTLTIMEECRNRIMMEQSQLIEITTSLDVVVDLSNQLVATLERLRLAENERILEENKKLEEERAIASEKELALKAKEQRMMAEKNPECSLPEIPKELRLSVSRSAYHSYLELRTLLSQYEEASKRFTSDKSNMKSIMAINKAISVPISSITNRAGSDVKNTLADLNAVLQGKNIKVGKQSITFNEDATSFACLSMAKKFVKQAEGQVSSNHNTAFSLSLTLIGVWCKHETFGKLLLAQLQSRCPFVVPWYVPQLPGQTDKDYNKSRGYLYDDDTVEAQDKYLSRMSGLVRTYAALIQSPLPPGIKVHPHGISAGWTWLARMLNLDPWPDVTSTVLYDFLEVSGHALMKAYGPQFQKLLYTLSHDYFPKIKEISGGGGGPLQRLQMFLKDCIKSKSVPRPDGHLDEAFWNTYHHTGVVGS